MPDGPYETEYPMPLRQPSSRWGDLPKMLPVLFVLGTISGLYFIYTFCHLLPMLQLMAESAQVDMDMKNRGTNQAIAFNIITFMLVLCYVRCVLVHPGEVPDIKGWLYDPKGGVDPNAPVQETKKDGQRRHCKWCSKYKPDRCHHCRVCRSCILKMDHHCPWIYNCVGYHNYKYFFLLLFYVMLDVHLIFWSMIESMIRYVQVETTFAVMFFTLFGLTLAFFLLSLVTAFFGFHCWLCSKGMTTIEFCEKKSRADGDGEQSIYNLGVIGNIQATLGEEVLLWFVPFGGPPGDGLFFETNLMMAPLNRDMEGNRGLVRRPSKAAEHEQHYHRNLWNKGAMYGADSTSQLIDGRQLWGAQGAHAHLQKLSF